VEPLLVYPDPPPEWLAAALSEGGYPSVPVSGASEADRLEPDDGWAGAVVYAGDDFLAGVELCRALHKPDDTVAPVLFVVAAGQLDRLDFGEDLFQDFMVAGGGAGELTARLAHLFSGTGRGQQHDLIAYGPLALNLETYQAALSGRPLDLTFMEYQLLCFLASHPGKVFTREVLLSRVWGYEYYGGARTVDVHVRRLRAKFGEEHAYLIDTVRSVGYRFGTIRWLP
jgi:two-component system alkaline phosphatase synthesis response regulator PhoP